jgi:hypothetical protein
MRLSEYRRARCKIDTRRCGCESDRSGGPGGAVGPRTSCLSSSSIGVGGMNMILGGSGGARGFLSGESTPFGCGSSNCIGGVDGSTLNVGCGTDPSSDSLSDSNTSLASKNGGVGVARLSRWSCDAKCAPGVNWSCSDFMELARGTCCTTRRELLLWGYILTAVASVTSTVSDI